MKNIQQAFRLLFRLATSSTKSWHPQAYILKREALRKYDVPAAIIFGNIHHIFPDIHVLISIWHMPNHCLIMVFECFRHFIHN